MAFREQRIGGQRLILGDCLEVMQGLGKVDAVVTDPPYGTTACAWDSVIPFEPMWREVRRVLKPRGAAIFTASQPFTSALVMSNPREFRYQWVWHKSRPTGHMNAKHQPMKAHEDILVFYSGKPTYNPQMETGEPNHVNGKPKVKSHSANYGAQYEVTEAVTSTKYPRTVLQFKVLSPSNVVHPTQKPVALMEYLIRTYTNEGETVLDFTMGSGTTLVACQKTGRGGIGIEIDPQYFDIACRRVDEAARQPDMLIDMPKPQGVQPGFDL